MAVFGAKFWQVSILFAVLGGLSAWADDSAKADAPLTTLKTSESHFVLHCKQPAPEAAGSDSNPASESNQIDTTPQMPLMLVSDFAQTGGKGKFNLDTFVSRTRYSQDGSTASRIVTVANLGLCDNIDMSVTAQHVRQNFGDGTSAAGSGDYNAFLKYQYYENQDRENRGKYAAIEVSLNGGTTKSQDKGIATPLALTIAHQYGWQLGDLKNGPIYGNVTAQYTKGLTAGAVDNVTAAVALGLPLTQNIGIQAEVGVGRDIGANSTGATQVISSVGFLGKLTKCSKWTLMAQRVHDSELGTQTQVFLGIRTAIDVNSHDCAL